jgi:hypothetical protein
VVVGQSAKASNATNTTTASEIRLKRNFFMIVSPYA